MEKAHQKSSPLPPEEEADLADITQRIEEVMQSSMRQLLESNRINTNGIHMTSDAAPTAEANAKRPS